jgi:hypothetical protein
MLISPLAVAAPAVAQASPADVALLDGGVLVGLIVSAEGAPIAGADVSIRLGGKEVAQARTNENGVYQIAGLRGGVYQVVSANTAGVYRFWSPRTAPPSARRGLMTVAGPQVVRGQYPAAPGPFAKAMGWIAEHPILTTMGVAAGIAIPLAINDDDPAS